MDFLRSCYRSEWVPFSNDLTQSVPGRFYFAPPGTPTYPGFSLFTSRVWYDSNFEVVQGVGERLDVKQIWDNGKPPPTVPLPQLIGTPACVLAGSSSTTGVSSTLLVDGFLSSCFQGDAGDTPLNRLTSVLRCSTQRACAQIIGWLYVADVARMTAFIHDWLGPTVSVTFHPPVGFMPSVITAITPDWSAAWVDGTRSFQQLALQGWESLGGPVDQGAFSTMPLWYQAAAWIHSHLSLDGADPTKPVFLSGHSYGAAACTVLAVQYILARRGRQVSLLTFGCPKVGDDRLVTLAVNANAIHIKDVDDLVTIIPPEGAQWAPFVPAFGIGITTLWGNWQGPTPSLVLFENGQTLWGVPPLPDFTTMSAVIARALAHIPESPVVGHLMPAYESRLTLRCPNQDWPLPPDANNYFAVPAVYHLELRSRLPGGRLGLLSGLPGPAGELHLAGGLPGPSGTLGLLYPAMVTPGPSCPTAGSLPVPFVYTGTINSPNVDWFMVPVTVGLQYTFIVTVNSGSLGTTNFYLPPCAALTPLGSIFFYPGSFVYLAGATGFIMVSISSNLFGSANYTLSTHSP